MQIPREREDERVDIPLTPMIDCVFLLLIFFLVTASLQTPHRELGIDLPRADYAAEAMADPRELVISVTETGRYYVDDLLVDQDELKQRLRRASRQDPVPRVRLDIDRRAEAEHVIMVVNTCQLYGLNEIAFRGAD